MPERNPQAHSVQLLENLARLGNQLQQLDAAIERAPEAEGHLVAVDAHEGSRLPAESLADRRAEIALVAETDEGAVVHLRRDDIEPLQRKIAAYGDDSKLSPKGRPRNEPLVAPLEGFRPATLADLSEGRLTDTTVEHGRTYWIELWTRGGRLEDDEVRDRVCAGVAWLAARVGLEAEVIPSFRATERDIYLLPLPGEVLRYLPTLLPEIYRIVEATPPIRDLILSEREAEFVEPENIEPASPDAVAVALLDTGVAAGHPLLAQALTSPGTSVVVGDPLPADSHGHGTKMAGLAAYADLGGQLLVGGPVIPRVALINVRILANDQDDDDDRELWPERTEEAVRAAEDEAAPNRVFNLSIGADNPDPGAATSWSAGLDLLAHNSAKGRLFLVAAGNVDVSPTRTDYPARNLVSFINDPAQALNAVTVGAMTDRVVLPDEAIYGDLIPLAGARELSPYSRTGTTPAPIKPELVFEGGNCAPDGNLPGYGVETLSLLTTDRAFAAGRLLGFSWATSAACASVSGLAGEIWNVNPTSRPETIRALLIHSARWTDALINQFPDRRDRLRAAGYGVPDSDLASYSFRRRPTLLIEDIIRPSVTTDDGRTEREVHPVRLPLPTESLLVLGDREVELSVTLSFFIEPNEANRRNYAGAALRWDFQRPTETTGDFESRTNLLEREPGFAPVGNPYPWVIGPDARSRGSVQSDRCRLTAASLAGEKLVSVSPVLGWWEGNSQRSEAAVPYSLVVTIDAGEADIDLYAEIEAAIVVPIDVE